MAKQKKVKFLDMKITNHSIEEAEKKVMLLFKAAKELGKEKIDVKIDFFVKKEVDEFSEFD